MSISNPTFVNEEITEAIVEAVVKTTAATHITSVERIQSLWSGYGEILRLHLESGPHLKDGQHRSVVLKHIKLPQPSEHPRGWNTDISHQRKLKSYRVESHWYQHFASCCDEHCPVPECLSLEQTEDETFLLLSDLAAAGFTEVKDSANQQDIHACLSWLAHFHARFLLLRPTQALLKKPTYPHAQGLWEQGSYWHLDTRPDELAALDDGALKAAAPLIDQALNQCQYQTLIHGDAKLANFCFAPDVENSRADVSGSECASKVAAVDFQYVGGGCGMKDVAYFLGSCLSDEECEALEAPLLDYYFQVLTNALHAKHPKIDTEHLEREWRSLFDVAWADFHRFLKGWSPDHWKLNSYSERLTKRVIERLNNTVQSQGI